MIGLPCHHGSFSWQTMAMGNSLQICLIFVCFLEILPPVRKKTGNKFLSANSSILTPEPSAQTIRPYYTATLIIRGAQVLLIILIYSGDCLPSTSMETMHAPCVIRNPIILEEIESLCDAPVLYCTAGRRMSNRKCQGITLDKLCAYANAIV